MTTGPSEEDRARIRGYIASQTEKYDLVDLWPRVIAQRTAYLTAIEGLTQEQALWRPPLPEGKTSADEEAWGILEVTEHLTTWTENVLGMAQAMSQGGTGEKLPVGYIEPDLDMPITEARRRLTDVSMQLSQFMASAEADANLDATVEHGLFGPLNIRGWVLFQRIHDVDHVNQVTALKTAEGFPQLSK